MRCLTTAALFSDLCGDRNNISTTMFSVIHPFENLLSLIFNLSQIWILFGWQKAFQLILLLFSYCTTVVFDKVKIYQKCLSVKVSKGLNWKWCWISIFIDPLLKVGPGGHLVIWRLSICSTWFQPGCGEDQSSRRLACLQLRFSETILLNFFFFELLRQDLSTTRLLNFSQMICLLSK